MQKKWHLQLKSENDLVLKQKWHPQLQLKKEKLMEQTIVNLDAVYPFMIRCDTIILIAL